MTNATISVEQRARDFVAAVGEHFADLSETDRDELLSDLEQHLLELANDAPDAFEAELGDPARYAAELRVGAGLTGAGPRTRGLGRIWVAARGNARHLLQHPQLDPVREYLPMLRPAWWIVRAWAPLVLFAMIWDSGSVAARHVVVPGRNPLGLLALVAAIAVSVRLGLRGLPRGTAGRIFDVGGGLAGGIVISSLLFFTPVDVVYVETFVDNEFTEAGLLTHPDGEGITNLFVYDSSGVLLRDVFVFDGAGRPVEVGQYSDEWFGIRSEYRVDIDGRVLGNLYPLTQYVTDPEGVLRLREVPAVTVPRVSSTGTEPDAPAPTVPGSHRPATPESDPAPMDPAG